MGLCVFVFVSHIVRMHVHLCVRQYEFNKVYSLLCAMGTGSLGDGLTSEWNQSV